VKRGKKPNEGYRTSGEEAPKMLEQAFPGVQLSPIYDSKTDSKAETMRRCMVVKHEQSWDYLSVQ